MKKSMRPTKPLAVNKLPASTTLQGLDTNNRRYPVQGWVVGRNKRYAVTRLFQWDVAEHRRVAAVDDLFTVVHVASGCRLDKWAVFNNFLLAKDAAEHADVLFGLHDFYQDEKDDMEWKVKEEAEDTLRAWADWARPRTIYSGVVRGEEEVVADE